MVVEQFPVPGDGNVYELDVGQPEFGSEEPVVPKAATADLQSPTGGKVRVRRRRSPKAVEAVSSTNVELTPEQITVKKEEARKYWSTPEAEAWIAETDAMISSGSYVRSDPESFDEVYRRHKS